MSKKEKSDFLKETHCYGTEDPLKNIDILSKLTTSLGGGHTEYIPPYINTSIPVKELRDVDIEMKYKLDSIISKIDALHEKPDILKVLLDLGMSLTVLEKAGIETPCLTFEGINTYIKLTIAQYNTLKTCGVPDLI